MVMPRSGRTVCMLNRCRAWRMARACPSICATFCARIVDAAKAVAPKVEDKMAYARGAASDFSGWAKAALAPLAFLKKGSAELVDGALSVVGEARDSAGYQSALQAAHKLPSGLSLAIARMPDKEQKIVFNRLREFESGMQCVLEHIKRRAES